MKQIDLLRALKEKSQQVYDQSLLALFCGLRFGEIANLTWADIDLPNNEIIQIRDAKGGSRQSFMTEPVIDMLTTPCRIANKHRQNDLLFPDRKGEIDRLISPVAFGKQLKSLRFNKGVTDKRYNVSFHTLRHTFRQLACNAGNISLRN